MRRLILTRALLRTHDKPLTLEAYVAIRGRILLALLDSNG